MFQDVVISEELAIAFLAEYFQHGGTITLPEQQIMINAMGMACAMWLTFELVQAPTFVEAET